MDKPLATSVLFLSTVFLGATAPARAGVDLIGVGTLPGDASDGLSLLPPLLEDGVTPHDRAGGWGSGLAYTGVGNLFVATPDRGPADGTTSYIDRYYLLDIAVKPGASPPVSIGLVNATTLTNEAGALLVGSSTAFDATNSPAGLRFDPEAVRLSGTGSFFVSDEYGPFLSEFSPTGERLRTLALPERFNIAHPNGVAASELPPGNTRGRQANRGMEGLAISPDGGKLFGLMQNALIQDGALEGSTRVGLNTRLIEIELATGGTRELVYVLDEPNHGLNEILAINDHEFLVIERDGAKGAKAKRKLIYKVDLRGASDVSCIDALPTRGLPEDVVPVKKSLVIDLLAPAFGLAGESFPEKIEGLAFGPRLADGRLTLLVTSDNDFDAVAPSKVFVFALPEDVVPNHRPQIMRPGLKLDFPGAVLRPGQRGLVPALLRGSALLPVSAFALTSLRLGGAPVVSHGRRPLCTRFDENDDGFVDLACVFDQAAVAVEDGDTVVLVGQTTTGTPLEARAPAKVSGPR